MTSRLEARQDPVSDHWAFDTFPPDWVRLPVCAWLQRQRHGVDPMLVAVPGWIERQPDTYRLAWQAYVPDAEHKIRLNEARDDAVREPRYVQLEGPPLPWPSELLAWVNYEALRPYAGAPDPQRELDSES